jgi:hypothetical protein
MLNRLLNYKHAAFMRELTPRLTEVKSKVFKDTYYIFLDGKLLLDVGCNSSLATDAHRLAKCMNYSDGSTEIERNLAYDLYKTEFKTEVKL